MERLGLSEKAVTAWIRKFRVWLLQLDPSGTYQRMVRLGIKPPSPRIYCPHCAADREARYHGYVSSTTHLPYEQRTRQFRCKTCQGFIRAGS
nr:DUF746 domain-containing protein [Cupriavidus basilensis]